MRYIILITALIINTSYAQEETFRNTYEYLFVDEVPRFENSSTDLYNYINAKIEEELPPKYYTDDLVIVSFIVDENGCVGEIKVIKYVTQRLRSLLPAFNTNTHNRNNFFLHGGFYEKYNSK